MYTYFNGFNTQEATFISMADVAPGRAVALQPNGLIYYAEAGTPFTGIVSTYDDSVASVVMTGYAVASFNETIPHVGICKLSVGASGHLELDEANGTPYTVVGVDLDKKTMEIIL